MNNVWPINHTNRKPNCLPHPNWYETMLFAQATQPRKYFFLCFTLVGWTISRNRSVVGFTLHNGISLASQRQIGLIMRSAEDVSTDVVAASNPAPQVNPDILSPFLPAADPKWLCRGPVGKENFALTREGGPTTEELANENILRIVQMECSDLEVNTLVWKCLGYRFIPETEEWTSSACFPNWREKFPAPPDFIGMRRIYSPEIDKPSLKANQALVKSIPLDHKQSLKEHLKPLGFRGYQYAELTPNKTRRAQCANWLIFYREELYGFSVDELRERRRLRLEEEAKRQKETGTEDEWKLPVREVI